MTKPQGKQIADKDATRPAKPGDTDTTRFGMEDGDNTETPATGVDPDRQSPERADQS